MPSHLNGIQEMLKLLYKVNKKNTLKVCKWYLIQFLSSVAQNGKDRRGLNLEKNGQHFQV